MSENVTLIGVVLYAPEGVRLVPLDAGGRRLRRVTVSTKALNEMGLSGPDAYADFLARIRLAPRTTVHGTFVVAGAGSAPLIVSAANLRPASEEEVRAAISIDINQSISDLRADGVAPTMSAEELMNLMRGDDEVADVSPSP
jgi:hypothetical protein